MKTQFHFFLKSITLLICHFVLLTSLLSQSLKGIVKDSKGEPLSGATITLLNAIDSTLISGEIADGVGKFHFKKLAVNSYLIRVSFIGLETYNSSPIQIQSTTSNIELPLIVMSSGKSSKLQEVVVTAKRPLIEQDVDKTIINVDAMISASTGNAMDVLEKTPGVIVSSTGELSLNGKNGVNVLIDGRATYMSGPDLAAYLKSLPGGMIDKIELMDNPPAKYDASGGAVINIRLKKNKLKGVTGNASASVSQGVRFRSYESLSLNLNKKRINWFANLGYSKEDNFSKDLFNRKVYLAPAQLESSFDINNRYDSYSQGLSARVGFDRVLNPKTTFGGQLNVQTRPRNELAQSYNTSTGPDLLLDSVGKSSTPGDFQWKSFSLNGNITHKINEQGREWNGDFNYIRYQFDGVQNFINRAYQPSEIISSEQAFNYLLFSGINIWNMKLDYTHPMKNKLLLEAGIKSSLVTNDNDSRYYNLVDGQETADDLKSNHFILDENVNAAYGSVRKSWARWSTQLGLRLENTRLSGDQKGNDLQPGSRFDRQWTGLFPNAFVNYKLDSLGNNTVTASLGRRINRPNYQEFNPFRVFRDQYSYRMGNPGLKPIYYERLEFRFQHKKRFGFGIQFNRAKNLIVHKNIIEDQVVTSFPENLSKGRLIILMANYSANPFKWWTMNTNFQYGRMHLNGSLGNGNYEQRMTSARLSMNHQFTFSKQWSGELNAQGSSRDNSGQYLTEARGRVSFSIQKKILKDKGSLRLSVEDLFFTQRTRENLVGVPLLEMYHYGEFDSRRIGLAFTYRFGQEGKGMKRKQREGADEEKGRAE